MGEFRLGNTAINQYRLQNTRINNQVLPLYTDYFTYVKAGEPNSYPGSGSTWFDITLNENNATLTNSPTFTSASISYFEFSSTQNADFGQIIPDANLAVDFQVAAWIYLDSYPTASRASIVSRWDGPSNKAFRMYVSSSGVLGFDTTNDGTTEVSMSYETFDYTVPTGSWIMVGVNKSSVLNCVWLPASGSLCNAGRPTVYTGSTATDLVGNDYDGTNFPGKIGEVRIGEGLIFNDIYAASRGYYGV